MEIINVNELRKNVCFIQMGAGFICFLLHGWSSNFNLGTK